MENRTTPGNCLIMFLLGIVGSTAFTNGFHNLLSHPDAGLMMSGVIMAMGAGLLLVGALMVRVMVRQDGISDAGRLQKIQEVLATVPRGIHKQIDENRELLEYLQKHVPQTLVDHPWIEGWIQCNDELMTQLEKVAGVENPLPQHSRPFPRPWPGTLQQRAVMANTHPDIKFNLRSE